MDLRIFSQKLLLLLPIAGLVIGLNYKVDPAHLFQTSYEKGIASLLSQGKNIANVDNYDDRIVQKLYIDDLQDKNDIVILGSSHAMSIHASFFSGKTMFNHSVSGAILEDHISISEIYHDNGIKLSTVIISLDPWLLNRNHAQIRRASLEDDFQSAVERLGLPTLSLPIETALSLRTRKYIELISPAYFQESVRFLFLGLKDPGQIPGNYYATADVVGETAIRLFDGSLSRNLRERSNKPSVKYVNATTTLQKFDQLNPELKSALEIWVLSLQKEDVRVIFLLTPYHPDAYSYMMDAADYRIIGDVQSYYEELAHRYDIPVLGSYDPGDIPCSADEFYDEQHPRESCMERILNDSITDY
jgi:hypothetical protein